MSTHLELAQRTEAEGWKLTSMQGRAVAIACDFLLQC